MVSVLCVSLVRACVCVWVGVFVCALSACMHACLLRSVSIITTLDESSPKLRFKQTSASPTRISIYFSCT